MTYIIRYLVSIAHFVPLLIMLVAIHRILSYRKLKKKGYSSTVRREILMAVYLIIIFALYSQTIFSDLDTFMQDGWLNINVEPFKFVQHSQTAPSSYFIINVLGNIIFFIPIGLMTPLLFDGNTFFLSAGTGLLISLSIEIIQLPLLRATDIDDLILNTAGAIIGFVLYRILVAIFPESKNTFRIIK